MNRRNIISLILFAWPALWLSAANSGDAAARLVSLGFENVRVADIRSEKAK